MTATFDIANAVLRAGIKAGVRGNSKLTITRTASPKGCDMASHAPGEIQRHRAWLV